MEHVKATRFYAHKPRPWVFLAGSIEMGAAKLWQEDVASLLSDCGFTGTVLNPRREDWDSSWKQEIDNPNFCNQVLWELNALECADKVLVFLDGSTKSPITLLEIGILTKQPNKVMIAVEDGFWRKGNVDIVCQKYGISTTNKGIYGLVDFCMGK